MSVHISSMVWKLEGVSPIEKLLLVKLADNANDAGVCWPSQARIARECCMDKSTVVRNLASLEEMGFITRTPGNHERNTVYQLHTEVINQSHSAPRCTAHLGAESNVGRCTERLGVGAQKATNRHLTVKEPSDGSANKLPEQKEKISSLLKTVPDESDVLDIAQKLGIPRSIAFEFFYHYESQGWVSGSGMSVTNWVAKLQVWWQKELRKDPSLAKQESNARNFPTQAEIDSYLQNAVELRPPDWRQFVGKPYKHLPPADQKRIIRWLMEKSMPVSL